MAKRRQRERNRSRERAQIAARLYAAKHGIFRLAGVKPTTIARWAAKEMA